VRCGALLTTCLDINGRTVVQVFTVNVSVAVSFWIVGVKVQFFHDLRNGCFVVSGS
jgi:hypothetical protein